MTHIVNQLADLTTLRDRQSLDSALVNTLCELLKPVSIAIHRLVGPNEDSRWLTCAELDVTTGSVRAANERVDIEALPKEADFPLRQRAMQSKVPLISKEHDGHSLFPLVAPTNVTAVLELTTAVPLTEELTWLVSGVLRLYQNIQGLLDYGERDALTELLNRKSFDGAFLKATTAQQLSLTPVGDDRRHAQDSGHYWLAMLDIDHFKRVNDNFGHLIGDEVLLLLARLMRSTFRFHDQLYRFGGEEFVVLMHCDRNLDAQAALQRLRINTEHFGFPQVGHITVSIGFTKIRSGDSPSGAFERADKAVYFAKEHGRNQVCSFEDLVAQGKLVDAEANVGDIELF